jgi:hypothetical protein
MTDPDFTMDFKARWQELRSGVLSNETIMNYIDSVALILDAPQQRNFTKWPILDQYVWPNNYVGGSYANELQYLKDWIASRLQWLDTQINAFEIITGLNEAAQSSNYMTVYPNPNHGSFRIRLSETTQNDPIQISIFNQLGTAVYHRRMQPDQLPRQRLEISEPEGALAPGVYVLKVSISNVNLPPQRIVVY